jgi:TRAP-type C4-dicarboxylate transport system permease small subunit
MRIVRFLNERFEEVLGSLCLAILIFLIFLGVVARLAFSSGLPWQEELARMLFVLMIYLGASYSILKSDHIRVTALVDLLPARAANALESLSDVVAIGFQLTLAWLASQEVIAMSEFPAVSGVLEIPLYLVFAIVPAMFLLMALRQSQIFWRRLTAVSEEGSR